MEPKRTIRGKQYNIPQLVDDAVATADGATLNTAAARESLARLGHRNPDEELVTRYARETAVLSVLSRKTGANFAGQIGKISFANRAATIQDVNDYLGRRNQGQHARWLTNQRTS